MLQLMTKLYAWVIPTFEFDFSDPHQMVYRNPEYSGRKPPPVEEDKTYSVEEEIMNMERNRRAIIRKVGGEKYDRLLARLIRRKQKKVRS